jgi:hypothetical protein
MRESPSPTHFCVLAIAQHVGEHFRGLSSRTNAYAAQILPIQRSISWPIVLSPADSPSLCHTMYVTLMAAFFFVASFVAPALSAPLKYVNPYWLIYRWHL